jgi:hypothetical protein
MQRGREAPGLRALARPQTRTAGAWHRLCGPPRLVTGANRPAETLGHAPWGPAPRRWLAEVGAPPPAQPSVLPAERRAVTAPTARLPRLAPALPARGKAWRLPPGGAALQALRGVQGTVAVPPVAERGALTRWASPGPAGGRPLGGSVSGHRAPTSPT